MKEKKYIIEYSNRTEKKIKINGKNYTIYDFTLKSIKEYYSISILSRDKIIVKIADEFFNNYVGKRYTNAHHMYAVGVQSNDESFEVYYWTIYTIRESPVKEIEYYRYIREDNIENDFKKAYNNIQNNKENPTIDFNKSEFDYNIQDILCIILHAFILDIYNQTLEDLEEQFRIYYEEKERLKNLEQEREAEQEQGICR